MQCIFILHTKDGTCSACMGIAQHVACPALQACVEPEAKAPRTHKNCRPYTIIAITSVLWLQVVYATGLQDVPFTHCCTFPCTCMQLGKMLLVLPLIGANYRSVSCTRSPLPSALRRRLMIAARTSPPWTYRNSIAKHRSGQVMPVLTPKSLAWRQQHYQQQQHNLSL